MLEFVEPYLARWTGRTDWPMATATLEERLKIPQGELTSMVPNTETADIFSWEVDGKTYVADVIEVAGEKNVMGAVGHRIVIQYNPRRPRQFYYAPACQLASRAVLIAFLVAGALAIALAIYLHR
jgi:hypothetical protein